MIYIGLVEVRGVEPLSEKCLPRLSPSAVSVLSFPCRSAHRQAQRFGSSLLMTRLRALPRSPLPLIDAPYAAEVLRTGTSCLRQLMQLYFCQLFLSCGFYGGSAPPLAYQGLHSPSKPLHPRVSTINTPFLTALFITIGSPQGATLQWLTFLNTLLQYLIYLPCSFRARSISRLAVRFAISSRLS